MIHNLESNAESADIILLILKIIAVIILLLLSSIFSGLNLGLLSLDKINLQILNDLGTDADRSRVKKIMKVRKHVLVSLLLENLTSPVVSFLISTVLTVFIGEIIPQAICCKYGLAIGAALWWLVFFFMIILSPFVFPLGYILDKILGQEVGSTYNRKQLKKLIEIHMREDIMDKYGEEGINKTDFIFLNDAFEFG
ncbi:MAG: putative metal transporter CNNM4, partial [Streblomastix strix]